jgi:DNA-binding winged helix-turn-helix (wHTH) protein
LTGRTPQAVTAVDVVLVLWPDHASDLERLEASGVPRLLLVAPEAPPPEDGDCLQDWVRLPAADQDVRARILALERRSARHRTRAPVTVSEDGRLSYRGRSTWLSPTVRRLFQALADRFGGIVALETLMREVWPEEPPDPTSVRVHILRLRRRLAPLGLEIRNVQSKGYVLLPHDPEWAGQQPDPSRPPETRPTQGRNGEATQEP